MWIPHRYDTSSAPRPERSTAPLAAATKFGRLTSSSPPFISGGVGDVEEVRRPATLSADAGSTEPPAGTFTWSENEPSVSAWQPSSSCGAFARQQAGDGPVAEVEHEARAPVRVVEQVRLAAGGDDQDVPQVGLGEQEVAREP